VGTFITLVRPRSLLVTVKVFTKPPKTASSVFSRDIRLIPVREVHFLVRSRFFFVAVGAGVRDKTAESVA
jgi:hypothetical protein